MISNTEKEINKKKPQGIERECTQDKRARIYRKSEKIHSLLSPRLPSGLSSRGESSHTNENKLYEDLWSNRFEPVFSYVI